jgi:hypothetical protein
MKKKLNSNGDTVTAERSVPPDGSRPSAPATPDTAMDPLVLLECLVAMRNGDFTVRLPSEWTGIHGRIADAFNDIVSANQSMAQDLERVSRVVGKEGKVNQRANFRVSAGAWRAMEDSVNTLITDLVWPTTEVTRTIGAVAKGDLSQSMSLEMEGRPLTGLLERHGMQVVSATNGREAINLLNATPEFVRVFRVFRDDRSGTSLSSYNALGQ